VKRIVIALVTAGSLASMGSAALAAPDVKEKAGKTVAAQPTGTLKPTTAKPTAAAPAADELATLEKAVARDSSKFDQLYRLGTLYLDRDRISEAGQVLRKANKVRPKDVPTLVNLGAVEDASGRADAAQKYYRAALELSPEDSVAVCRLASSLYAQSKYTESMDMLRGLIASKPNSHCAYFTLGVAFADAGIYRDAVRMWKKVVELAPESQEAASARESIDVLEKFISGK
jgi:tetratricopeptide (TPR) repeat protein